MYRVLSALGERVCFALLMFCALVVFLGRALYVLCSGGVPELGFICVVLWWCSWAGLNMLCSADDPWLDLLCCALVVFLGWASYVLCSGDVPGIALGLDIMHGML